MAYFDGERVCCYEAVEWRKHAKEISKELTDMIPTKKDDFWGFDTEDLEQLDSEKLITTRDFARKLLNDKFLHTKTWTHDKLVSFEQRITTQIEVIQQKHFLNLYF